MLIVIALIIWFCGCMGISYFLLHVADYLILKKNVPWGKVTDYLQIAHLIFLILWSALIIGIGIAASCKR